MKRLITFYALVLYAAIALAQIKYGVSLGVNINHVGSSSKELKQIMKNKGGWSIGATAEYMFPSLPLGVDGSLLYQRLNSEMEYMTNSTPYGELLERRSIGRDYIILPFNLKCKISFPILSYLVKPMLLTGPEFSFRLNRKEIGQLSEETISSSWNIGIGADLFKHIQLTILYGIPLSQSGYGVVPYQIMNESVSYKNHVWKFNLAIYF